MATDALAGEMHEAFPECTLKDLIFAFVDAGIEGHLDGEGRVDVRALEDRVRPEVSALAYEIVVDEGLFPTETPAWEVLTQILRRFVLKKLDAEQKIIRRRLNDPDEDQAKAVEDLQALLVRRRAQGGTGLDTGL